MIRHVDEAAPLDLQALGRTLSERSDGWRMGVSGAADPARQTRRTPARDEYARGDERHPLPPAHGLSVALLAARRFPAAIHGLQHLPQFQARWRLGRDLGKPAHGLA